MSSSDSDSDLTQNLTEQDNNSVIDLTEEDSNSIDLTRQDSSDSELGSEDVRITINPGNFNVNDEELPEGNPAQLIHGRSVLFSPRPRPFVIPDEQDTTVANPPTRFSIYPYRNSIPTPEPTEEKEITNPIYIKCIACKEKMINTICYPCQHAILCCKCAR